VSNRSATTASRRAISQEELAALEAKDILQNPVLRMLFIALGWVAVAFGTIGIFVPGWPTTVWILVAAFFFARSSPRFYRWLLTHRVFGPTVRDIRLGRGLSRRVKAYAISMNLLFVGGSAAYLGFGRDAWVIAVIVISVGLVGVAYILKMPTRHDG